MMIGQTISHYRILEKLGEGGMGIVYKAHDTKLDRPVALKFLPRHLAPDNTEKERFFHEARAASALNHPHITTIYEIDEHVGQSFIAMEYVEGKTLKQLIESETPSFKKMLDIAIQVCDGLAAAHEKGVVHRDIKADNIMVTSKGQVKIMDFGLAKLRGAAKLTQEGSTVGTAAYMSPEQATGEEVDQRSDIFSFGVVLYELLTGKLPFRGEHQAAILYSIVNEEPQPIARFNDKVSPELERVVSKALAKDRDERYQHIDDLLADLRRERKNLEYVKASAVTQPAAVTLRPRKRITPILAAVLAVAALAVLLIIFNPFQLKVSKEDTAEAALNSLAVMYFENIPDPADKDHTGEMLTNLLITALSQAKGLEVISRERLYDIQKELGQADAKTISPPLASQIAQRASVKTMLLGTIVQGSPKLAITARLVDVKTGKILGSQRLTDFSPDEIFMLVDSLATLVRDELKITSPAEIATRSVAEVTTGSPEAYRSYIEGVELYKRFYYSESKAALERAIELDPEFAMAYFWLAQLYGGLGDTPGQRKALQRARDLSRNATERERLQIEAAHVRIVESNPSKSAELLEMLLQKYPLEIKAYFDLSRSHHMLGEYDKALQTYLTGLRHDPMEKNLWNSLAYLYAGLGRKTDALAAIDQYLKLAPGEPNPYDSKGEIHFLYGEIDSALYWYRRAVTFRADFITIEKMGNLALLEQDYETAEKYYQQFASTPDNFQKAVAENDRALIPIFRGQFKKATEQMLRNLESHKDAKLHGDVINYDYLILSLLAYERRDYPAMLTHAKTFSEELRKNSADRVYGRDFLAWAMLLNGKSKTSADLLHEIQKDIQESLVVSRAQYNYTAALIAYEDGKYDAAVKSFEKSLSRLYPNRAPQYYYAVSLLHSGRISEATNELHRLTSWSPISFPPISLSFLPTTSYWPIASVKAHYWLGVAHEQQGETDKAMKEYEKFLDIWKDADTDVPELKDARYRLAKLKQE